MRLEGRQFFSNLNLVIRSFCLHKDEQPDENCEQLVYKTPSKHPQIRCLTPKHVAPPTPCSESKINSSKQPKKSTSQATSSAFLTSIKPSARRLHPHDDPITVTADPAHTTSFANPRPPPPLQPQQPFPPAHYTLSPVLKVIVTCSQDWSTHQRTYVPPTHERY